LDVPEIPEDPANSAEQARAASDSDRVGRVLPVAEQRAVDKPEFGASGEDDPDPGIVPAFGRDGQHPGANRRPECQRGALHLFALHQDGEGLAFRKARALLRRETTSVPYRVTERVEIGIDDCGVAEHP
jgi:hypothetical protein